MVTKVVMPRLSLTMKEGTVGIWYKKEGDIVEKGEPIVEVLSEKATYDLEAPASGILRKILVEEGVDAPVNAVLAVITAPDELFSETEILAEVPQTVEEAEKRVLASPAAKRLAREYGIDLSLVKGSGPEGRIVEEDVRRFVEETRGILPKVKEIIPLSGFRKTSAERVSLSFKTAPHSTIMMEVDVSKATELHEKLEVSYTAILVKAVAKALTEHPIINSMFEENQIKIFEDVNVGVAVATEYGLVVPVIQNADRKSLKEIDATIKELTEKARQGKLTREDLSGGTFTITNLGMYGVEFFTPIINPPEAAILGVGKIVEKPIVISGKIETKPFMTLSLSYDHRIVDGAPAAEFLRKIKEKIEETLGFEG
ncbi:MAG: dihydrolipoamide acetyltransferase family protein [Candidatus Bathyarchaeia archaeon]|nr:dihydrolipoamide acetyltransferase family protein [Candidatus Bathyarchaeia archaeon]